MSSANSKGGSVAKRFRQMASARFGFNDFHSDDARAIDMDKIYENAKRKISRKPNAHILLFMENKFKCAAYKILLEQNGFLVTHCFRSRDVFAKHLRNSTTAFDAVVLEWECGDDVRGRDVVSFYEHAYPEYPLLFIALVAENYPPSMAIRGGADLFLRLPLIIHVPVLRQLLLPQISVSVKFPAHTLAVTPGYKKIVDALSHMSQQHTRKTLEDLQLLASDVNARLSAEESEFLTEHEASILVKNVAKLVAPTGKFKVNQTEDEEEDSNDDHEPTLLFSSNPANKKNGANQAVVPATKATDFESRVQQLVSKRKKTLKYSVDFQFLQDIVGAAKMMKSKFDDVQAENKILRRFVRKALDITPRPNKINNNKKATDTNTGNAINSKNDDDDDESSNNSHNDDADPDHHRAERRAMKELQRDQAIKSWLHKSNSSEAASGSLQLPLSVVAALSKYSAPTAPLPEVTAADGELAPKSKILESALHIQDRLFQVEAELARTQMALKSTKKLEGIMKEAVKKMTVFRDPATINANSTNSPGTGANSGGLKLMNSPAKPKASSSSAKPSPTSTPQARNLNIFGSNTTSNANKNNSKNLMKHQIDDSDLDTTDSDNEDDDDIDWSELEGQNIQHDDHNHPHHQHHHNNHSNEKGAKSRNKKKSKAATEPGKRTICELLEERLMFQEDTASHLLVRSGATQPIVFRHRWLQERPLVNPAFLGGFDSMSAIMTKICVILNDLSVRVATLYPPCYSRFSECSTAFKNIVDDVRWELAFEDDTFDDASSSNPGSGGGANSSPLMKRGMSGMLLKNLGKKLKGNNAAGSSPAQMKAELDAAHKLRVAKVRGTRLARCLIEKAAIRRVIDVWYAWLLLRRQQRVFDEEKNDMKRMQYILSNVKLEKAQKEKMIESLLARATERDNNLRLKHHPHFGGSPSRRALPPPSAENKNRDDDNDDDDQIKNNNNSTTSKSPGSKSSTKMKKDATLDLLEMIQNHQNEEDFSDPYENVVNQVNKVFENISSRNANNNNNNNNNNSKSQQQQQQQRKSPPNRNLSTNLSKFNINIPQVADVRILQNNKKAINNNNNNNQPLIEVARASSNLVGDDDENEESNVSNNNKVGRNNSNITANDFGIFDASVGKSITSAIGAENSQLQQQQKPQNKRSNQNKKRGQKHRRNQKGDDDDENDHSDDDDEEDEDEDDHDEDEGERDENRGRRNKQSSTSKTQKRQSLGWIAKSLKKAEPKKGEFGHDVKGGKWSQAPTVPRRRRSESNNNNNNEQEHADDYGRNNNSTSSPETLHHRAFGSNYVSSKSPNSGQQQQSSPKKALSKEEQARLVARLTRSTIGNVISKKQQQQHDDEIGDEENANENRQQDERQNNNAEAAENSSTTPIPEEQNNKNTNNNMNNNHRITKKFVSFRNNASSEVMNTTNANPSNNTVTTATLHTISLGGSMLGNSRVNNNSHHNLNSTSSPSSPINNANTVNTVDVHTAKVITLSPSPPRQQHQQTHRQFGSSVTAMTISPTSVVSKPRPVMNFDALTGMSISSPVVANNNSNNTSQRMMNGSRSARVVFGDSVNNNNNTNTNQSSLTARGFLPSISSPLNIASAK